MDWVSVWVFLYTYLLLAQELLHLELCVPLPGTSKDIKLGTQMQWMFSLASKLWELNLAFCNQGEVRPSEWKL